MPAANDTITLSEPVTGRDVLRYHDPFRDAVMKQAVSSLCHPDSSLPDGGDINMPAGIKVDHPASAVSGCFPSADDHPVLVDPERIPNKKFRSYGIDRGPDQFMDQFFCCHFSV